MAARPDARITPGPQSARPSAQWSRTAIALGVLFGSLPPAGKLILGSWGFGDAAALSLLCFLAGGYLHLRSRRHRVAPDPAALLDRALQLAAEGDSNAALAVLTEAIRENPRLWQAFQYRGEIRLQSGRYLAAIDDFDAALEIAPAEPHLRALRDYAGQEAVKESKSAADERG